MKVIEHKCFGIDDSWKSGKKVKHNIIFKIDNGNYVLKLTNQTKKTKELKKLYYYTDSNSFELDNYNDFESFESGKNKINQLSERGIFTKVSYYEKVLIDKYFEDNNCQLLFRNDNPYKKGEIYKKCDLEFIELLGVIKRDEYGKGQVCKTHILVKFGVKKIFGGNHLFDVVVVNRVTSEIDYNIIDDKFYYSYREHMDEVGRDLMLSFNKDWKTKEEFNNEGYDYLNFPIVGNEFCDYLNYIHYGLGLLMDRSDYYLGKKHRYSNDNTTDLPKINDLLRLIDSEVK